MLENQGYWSWDCSLYLGIVCLPERLYKYLPIALGLVNEMAQACDDGLVVVLCLTIGLKMTQRGHEVSFPRNVHNSLKSLLRNCKPLSIRRKRGSLITRPMLDEDRWNLPHRGIQNHDRRSYFCIQISFDYDKPIPSPRFRQQAKYS